MSNAILIIGPSGSGKSTSLRKLDPASTFIISVLDKPLPMRGYKKNYKALTKDNPTGNYYITDEWAHIVKLVESISTNRPEITTLIVDDFNYLMAHEFMERASEKGYDRFNEIAQHAWLVLIEVFNARADLTVFIMAHTDLDGHGKSKCRTVGKMLDDKIDIEGMFTTILHTRQNDDKYLFLTQGNNEFTAKSPMEMFKDKYIPNDLLEVKTVVESYFKEE